MQCSELGVRDVHAHSTDIFGKRHDQFLTDGVDGRVSDLCELLTEIVEEQLRTFGDDCQRRIVTHGGSRLNAVDAHRNDGAVDVLLVEAEIAQLAAKIVDIVADFTATLELVQFNTVG